MSELIKETIEKIAAEKFPDSKEDAEKFIEGFLDKMAAWQNPREGGFDGGGKDGKIGFGGHLTKGLGEQLGKGLMGTAVGLGVAGVAKLVSGVQSQALHNSFLQALIQATQMNVLLKKTDKEKLRSYGETLFRFAPHVATDPNMLAHLLSNAVQGDGMDAQTIRLAADLENRYQQNTAVDTRNYS